MQETTIVIRTFKDVAGLPDLEVVVGGCALRASIADDMYALRISGAGSPAALHDAFRTLHGEFREMADCGQRVVSVSTGELSPPQLGALKDALGYRHAVPAVIDYLPQT